jgi:hypothetical protein
MPCPVYLYAEHKEDGARRVVSYQVLFAQHDGDSAKLYVCHPAFSGLVTADEVSTLYPAVLMIDPSAEEAEEAMLLVRAKAVASELPRQGKGAGPDRDFGKHADGLDIRISRCDLS